MRDDFDSFTPDLLLDAPVPPPPTRGRPRVYSSAAERQRAFRQRRRAGVPTRERVQAAYRQYVTASEDCHRIAEEIADRSSRRLVVTARLLSDYTEASAERDRLYNIFRDLESAFEGGAM